MRVALTLGFEDLKCDVEVDQSSGSPSGLTQDIRMRVLSFPRVSLEMDADRVLSAHIRGLL